MLQAYLQGSLRSKSNAPSIPVAPRLKCVSASTLLKSQWECRRGVRGVTTHIHPVACSSLRWHSGQKCPLDRDFQGKLISKSRLGWSRGESYASVGSLAVTTAPTFILQNLWLCPAALVGCQLPSLREPGWAVLPS